MTSDDPLLGHKSYIRAGIRDMHLKYICLVSICNFDSNVCYTRLSPLGHHQTYHFNYICDPRDLSSFFPISLRPGQYRYEIFWKTNSDTVQKEDEVIIGIIDRVLHYDEINLNLVEIGEICN